MSVTTARGGADGDENRICSRHCRPNVVGKMQPVGIDIARDQIFQSRLIDRHHAIADSCNFFSIIVDASDIKAKFRETRARHKADITSTNDRDFHVAIPG